MLFEITSIEDTFFLVEDEDGDEYKFPSSLLPKNKGITVGSFLSVSSVQITKRKMKNQESEEVGGFTRNPSKIRYE